MRGMLKGQMVKVKSIEKSKNTETLTAIFTVANRIKVKDKDGKPIPQYFQCYAFGKNAERIRDDFDKKKDDGKIDSRKIDLYGTVQIIEFENEEEKFLEKSAKAMFKAFGIFDFLDEIEQLLKMLNEAMPDPSLEKGLEFIKETRNKGETKKIKIPFKDKGKRLMVKFIVEHIEYVDDGKGNIDDEDRDIMIVDEDTSSSIDHLLHERPSPTNELDDFINPDKFKNKVPY